jgi:hypothetical protein
MERNADGLLHVQYLICTYVADIPQGARDLRCFPLLFLLESFRGQGSIVSMMISYCIQGPGPDPGVRV